MTKSTVILGILLTLSLVANFTLFIYFNSRLASLEDEISRISNLWARKLELDVVRTIADWNANSIPGSEWWEMETCVAIARMWLNYRVNEANAWFEQVTDKHGTDRYGKISPKKFPHPYKEPDGASHDWDFVTTYIIRAYFQFRDSPLLSTKARDNMRSVLAFRAGTPEVAYSENHNVMIVSAGYFGNVITGGDNTENERWLADFLDDKLKYHYWEMNSPEYMGSEYRVLWNLYDFSPSSTLKRKAKAVLDMLLAEHAVIHVAGIRGGPFYRYYGNRIIDQSHDYIYAMSHVYFGTPFDYTWKLDYKGWGWFPRIFAWYSSYKVPKIILDLAKAKKEPFVFKSRRKMMPTYYYVTPHFVLATAQGDFPDKYFESKNTGARAHVWDVSFDTSPRKVIFSGAKEDTWLFAESDAVQYKNVLITSFDAPIQYYGVTKVTESGWTFVQEGKTYVAIKKLSNGRTLLEVRDADDYGKPFSAFKSDIKDNYLKISLNSFTYKNTFDDTISSPTRYTIEGDSFSYKLFDSPYLVSDWDSGVIIVKHGSTEYRIQG